MIELLIGFGIGFATGIVTLILLMRYYFTRKLNTVGIESPQNVINELKSMMDALKTQEDIVDVDFEVKDEKDLSSGNVEEEK